MDNFGLLFAKSLGGGGGSGTDNYNELSNKPQINSITLSGNKSLANLGIQAELTFDNEPTEESTNPVTSGAVYTALATKQDTLTVDSAPTENSTNPVQSGGVYTALAGKEDTLTFDDAPTNNSDNPVKSGGIYTALGQKQDTLTFDGTYSASTNAAATVSTVTNAIGALDVTGESGISASKTISAWSETDGKVSISTQDIAIAGTQTTLTGYAKSGTAGQAVAATDNVNQAIGKLEATIDDNKNNILSLTANGGGKNKLQITATSTTEMTINDDKSVSITVYATTAKQYNLTGWIPNNYVGMKISGMTVNSNVSTGYFISVQYSNNGSSLANETDIATIGSATILDYPYIRIAIVVRENNNINDVLFKPMISVDGGDFQPYALSNAELTANILPSSYNAVEVETGAPISILSGGYARIGNLVCVNLKISVTDTISQADPLVKGLPKPILEYNTGYGAVSLTNNIGRVFNVIGVGSIAYGDSTSISSGTVILSGMYIAQ